MTRIASKAQLGDVLNLEDRKAVLPILPGLGIQGNGAFTIGPSSGLITGTAISVDTLVSIGLPLHTSD